MALAAGSRIGPYEIVSRIGAGGMGEIFRAHDTKLNRDVAIKLLPPGFAHDTERVARFRREAQVLASLNHPNVASIFGLEESAGTLAIALELVEGEDLAQRMTRSAMPLGEVVATARAIADGLGAAHARGVVHRDLKPANVMMTVDGRIKILDFGLAKTFDSEAVGVDDETSPAPLTQRGAIVGTVPYMSPEQVGNKPVAPPSDVFSFGIVLYEMLTGHRPFKGDSTVAVMSSILRDAPPPPSQLRHDSTEDLDALVARCLEKDPSRRPSASEVREALTHSAATPDRVHRPLFLRPALLLPALLIVLGAGGAIVWKAENRRHDAEFVAASLPRIEQLARDAKSFEAVKLADEVERVRPGAVPKAMWDAAAYQISIHSRPAGASISYRRFATSDAWTHVGVTPLENIRVPKGPLQWRAELAGYLPADFATPSPEKKTLFELRKATDSDREMILIPGGSIRLWVLGSFVAERSVTLGPFLIDRREVTNREFARFVEAGGYSNPRFWTHEFRDGPRTLSFSEAMARFRDPTGRPGPATWRLGGIPDGEDDLPVSGISWYEAAAFAEFAGKELPTVYHWYRADTGGDLQEIPGLVLPASNYEGKAPRPASAARVSSAFGAIDMAGNVREWSASASTGGLHLILGGAFSDPAYQYLIPETREPFDRSAGNGVRCIKRLGGEPLPEAATRVLVPKPPADDPSLRVPEPMYRAFTRFFETAAVPLDPRIESTDASPRHWIRQKVSYAAGYNGERVTAWLYLPKSARPPYQVVIQMAGASTFSRRTSATEEDIFGWAYAEYLIRGGRAVLLPLWKGSYERSDGFAVFDSDTAAYREHVIDWVNDLRHSIDYLETRNDIDATKIAYQGISMGATFAPQFLALEPRLKTGVLLLGGLLVLPMRASPFPPEIDMVTFAPRVKVPVLMQNGRNDAIFPYETAQVPLFNLLGTPPQNKRHVTYPGGHSTFGWRDDLTRESLDWLDRWLGPPVPAH